MDKNPTSLAACLFLERQPAEYPQAVNLTAFLLTLFVILFVILEFKIKLYFKFNKI